jgi:glycosyltransferase involved in cell wall biosynthesis
VKEVVSIITPSYNRASLVTETAESILAQTYPHWEWMIVDDGSTDNSWEVLQELSRKDSRIKIFQRDRGPKGACVCRNIAVEKSTGSHVIFLDTDDIMAPFCLEQRMKAAQENPESDFIIFPMLLFKKQLDDVNLLWNVDKEQDDLMRMFVNDPICQGTGTLWKKKTFQEIGMWREDLRIWQDVELHIRSFLWPVKYSKRMDLLPDVYLRISDDSLSRVGYHDLPKVKSRIEVYLSACTMVNQKNLVPVYKNGLRTMGSEIILGLIFQNYFTEGVYFLKQLKALQLFTPKELNYFKTFLFLHRYKIDKIKALDLYYYAKVKAIAPEVKGSVGVLFYNSGEAHKNAVHLQNQN